MSQGNYPTFDGDERSSLLKKVQTKDDFRAKKWRCVKLISIGFEKKHLRIAKSPGIAPKNHKNSPKISPKTPHKLQPKAFGFQLRPTKALKSNHVQPLQQLRTQPVRAFETLSPYAVLEVGIMGARDLTERESGFFNTDTTPDPYVQVILDDTELLRLKKGFDFE